MENKKLGILLIIFSIFILVFLVKYNSEMNSKASEIECFPSQECRAIEKLLSVSHIAVGIFSFLFALGFYLLFFNKTEKAILERLEKEKEDRIEDLKFKMIMKALDPFERKVIESVREQEGITQNTLRLRTEMSKAKLSYVLKELEKRGIIKRIAKGKTLAVYLRV